MANDDLPPQAQAVAELGDTGHERPDIAEITVLIPAAGRVPEGLLGLANIACPAMIPVAGRPVVYWTMKYLRGLGIKRFVIAVPRRGTFVEDFVECAFGRDCEVEFIAPEIDCGLGRTVSELAARAKTRSALVVLGDTHFQFVDPTILLQDEAAVLVQPVEDSYRWCIAELDATGLVKSLRDKQPDLAGDLQALIGVYFFPDLAELQAASLAAFEDAKSAGRNTEMADILQGIQRRRPIRALQAADWLDCGNPDRRASSHRALLQKRDFNELSIDTTFGTVTKRSRYVEKFLDEINYFRLLPPELSILFPRVIGFSTDADDPWLTMEYYGYPTLAEVFVFENLDPTIWEHVFLHLRDILMEGFLRNRRPLAKGVLREMYINKTQQRSRITAPPELLELIRHDGPLEINGRKVENLPRLWQRLEHETRRLSENVQGAVVHGDLCLSNVLYDLRSHICKLIDPRGSFGAPGIHGDPRYDVAKLYHSIHGLYDFITNDLFQVSVDGASIELHVRQRPQHEEICRRFEKVFFSEFDRREILLITGLLFVSMAALHYEAPRRQLAMYVRGLQLLDEALAKS